MNIKQWIKHELIQQLGGDLSKLDQISNKAISKSYQYHFQSLENMLVKIKCEFILSINYNIKGQCEFWV